MSNTETNYKNLIPKYQILAPKCQIHTPIPKYTKTHPTTKFTLINNNNNNQKCTCSQIRV